MHIELSSNLKLQKYVQFLFFCIKPSFRALELPADIFPLLYLERGPARDGLPTAISVWHEIWGQMHEVRARGVQVYSV